MTICVVVLNDTITFRPLEIGKFTNGKLSNAIAQVSYEKDREFIWIVFKIRLEIINLLLISFFFFLKHNGISASSIISALKTKL